MDTARVKKLIAVLQWDLKYTEKDRIEFEKLAAAAVKRKQPTPDYVKPRPELRYELRFYYNAYCELQANDFTFAECKQYAEYYGIDFELFRYILRVMKNNGYTRIDGA